MSKYKYFLSNKNYANTAAKRRLKTYKKLNNFTTFGYQVLLVSPKFLIDH